MFVCVCVVEAIVCGALKIRFVVVVVGVGRGRAFGADFVLSLGQCVCVCVRVGVTTSETRQHGRKVRKEATWEMLRIVWMWSSLDLAFLILSGTEQINLVCLKM